MKLFSSRGSRVERNNKYEKLITNYPRGMGGVKHRGSHRLLALAITALMLVMIMPTFMFESYASPPALDPCPDNDSFGGTCLDGYKKCDTCDGDGKYWKCDRSPECEKVYHEAMPGGCTENNRKCDGEYEEKFKCDEGCISDDGPADEPCEIDNGHGAYMTVYICDDCGDDKGTADEEDCNFNGLTCGDSVSEIDPCAATGCVDGSVNCDKCDENGNLPRVVLSFSGISDGEAVTKTMIDDNFTIAATPNPATAVVSYASSNGSVATVNSGGLVSIVGVGNTTITANAAGITDTHSPAVPVTYNLTVTLVNVTITPADREVTFAGDTFDVSSSLGSGTLFSISPGSGTGTPTYTLKTGVGGTGEGTLNGTILTVTKAGTFVIGLTTDANATHAAGTEETATLTVKKGTAPGAPSINKVDATPGQGDGKITGLTISTNAKYEYSINDFNTATDAITNENGEITGLAAGTYKVRVKETDLFEAGTASGEVVIAQQYSVNAPAAIELNGVTATLTIAPADGQLSGTAMTATITLAGNATAAGVHTVGLTSTQTPPTPPGTQTKAVETGTVTAPNTFAYTFNMPQGGITDLAMTHTFVEHTFTISASTLPDLDFGAEETGYQQPVARTVTITNTGTGSVTLNQPTATGYDISAPTPTTVAAGGTATFTVRPNFGLAIGEHNATINITGNNGASASIDAKFEVTSGPPPLSGTLTINFNTTNGELTAYTGGLNGTGTLSYEWSGTGVTGTTNAATYITTAASYGQEITLKVTRAGTIGEVTATITIYRIEAGTTVANGTTGNFALTSAVYGKVGDNVTFTYNLGNATGVTFNSGITLSSGNTIYTINSSHATAGVITITATFTAPTFTVTYNLNGGTQETGTTWGSYTFGVGLTLPTVPTRTGHTFGGWFDNSSLTGTAVTAILTTDTGNKSYWAKWDINQYTISFNAGSGGGGTMGPATVNYGSNYTIPANTFTHSTQVFNGWKDVGGTDYDAGATINNITSNITLTAQWRAKSTDANITAIAGQTITWGGGDGTNDTTEVRTAAISVPNSVDAINVGNITRSPYSVPDVCATGTSLQVGENIVSIEITAEDGSTKLYYEVTITRAAATGGGGGLPPPSGGGGGGPLPSTTPPSGTIPTTGGQNVPVTVNPNTGAVTVNLTESTTQTLINNALAENGSRPTVTLDLSGMDDATAAVLPAAAMDALADAEVSVTVKFSDVTITLPPAALATLSERNGNVTINASTVSMRVLQGMQAAQVRGYETIVSIDIYVGGRKTDVPITVSLPYTLKAGENPSAVRVWHMDNNGNMKDLNGVFNRTTGMITFTTDHQSYFVVGYDPVSLWVNNFNDVSRASWYYDAVAFASFNRLLVGDGGNSFNPKETMTRAMFVTALWNLEGNPAAGVNAPAFTDVNPASYHYEAIRWAADKGIVKGIGGNRFAPDRVITRQEMAVMMVNYADTQKINIPKNREMPRFRDTNQIDMWAESAAKRLSEAGVMSGYNNEFMPRRDATRAEAAGLLRNFMRLIVR
jgi:uncharacterized repeat protein (TIGR02543 family)